ncbi:hypothetical protein GO755_31480 [Spirosoma sp. HMF4905]|uniref:TMF family protein n=1 Tax=Spirosoma arboris TaxID=2682092 RepID=A0A7K1SLN9_9BACT|nr:hypothetical protein [Spirosoma arboris]MVM34593.1 hypothetical protein [Spirosoma arboris]
MTKLSIFSILLLMLPNLLLAQGNYVANSGTTSNTATYGTFNTFVGPGAGNSGHVTGNRNTVTGYNAGISLTSGSLNSFFGVDAGENTTSGSYNTFVGRSAGLTNSTGYENVFTGAYAGYTNTSGFENVFTGSYAGYGNTTGALNMFAGYYAGYSNTSGSNNVFMGANAGYANATGGSNVFMGAYAGVANSIGNSNVFIGNAAGEYSRTGNNNVFLGQSSGFDNKASNNTFLGFATGFQNGAGGNNTFVGYQAGYSNTSASNNTFVGYQAGFNNTTGSNNIIIGPNSGTAITTSDDNILMGYNSQADDGLQNAIAIGANSRVAASNALILGNQVNVGIGTSAPTNRLEVVSPSPNTSGLTLTNLTTASPTNRTTDQFLTVNEKGDVIKARYQLRINNASEWSDKVFAPDYNLQSLAEVKKYIDANQHLPGLPSAEQVVHDGVDLVKMNATLLEKVEELTLYSIEQDKKAQKQEERIDQLEQLLKQLLGKK